MSVEINWQAVSGILLLLAGGGWSGWQWWSARRGGNPPEVATRSADELPPPGAVDWVADIQSAMSGASPESVLACLVSGSTRDEARSARILELESQKPARAAK